MQCFDHGGSHDLYNKNQLHQKSTFILVRQETIMYINEHLHSNREITENRYLKKIWSRTPSVYVWITTFGSVKEPVHEGDVGMDLFQVCDAVCVQRVQDHLETRDRVKDDFKV